MLAPMWMAASPNAMSQFIFDPIRLKRDVTKAQPPSYLDSQHRRVSERPRVHHALANVPQEEAPHRRELWHGSRGWEASRQ
jgi:hypothetical protein